MKREPFHRIVNATLNSKVIAEDDEYTLASTDYLLGGGDELPAFKEATIVQHPVNNTNLCDLVIANLHAKQVVVSQKEGRIFESCKKK